MGIVHRLLEDHGKQATLLEIDRPVVEAAASYLADDGTAVGFLHSGWCQAALPHKRLADNATWQISTNRVTLIVAPGHRPGAQGAQPVGVPYGSRARLIMFYLQSEALRTRSRQIHLGRSMREWLGRLGVPVGGKSLALIRDQADRISRCHLSLTVRGPTDRQLGFANQTIVDGAIFLDSGELDQESLFIETAYLSEKFFAELQRHPVPLEEAAIKAIANNSQALDLYAWLAYRLHALNAPTPVSWAALRDQFGTGYRALKHFKSAVLPNINLALAVYPDAKVEMTERGLTLHPSRPPISPDRGRKSPHPNATPLVHRDQTGVVI